MSARAHAKSKFSPTHRLNLEEWSLTKNPNLLSNNVCLTNRQFGWNWFVAVSSTQKREFCNEFVSQKSHQSQKKKQQIFNQFTRSRVFVGFQIEKVDAAPNNKENELSKLLVRKWILFFLHAFAFTTLCLQP